MKRTWALILIILGVLVLLSSVGLLHATVWWYVGQYWPVVLVLWGAEMLGRRFLRGRGGVLFPLVLIILGIVLLLRSVGLFGFAFVQPFSLLLAFLLIYVGVMLVTSSSWKSWLHWKMRGPYKGKWSFGDHGGDHWDWNAHDPGEVCVGKSRRIGDVRLGDTPWHLEPLNIDNLAGTVRINLATATIPDGETPIEILGGAGEVRIKVPAGLPVDVRAEVLVGEVRLFDRKLGGLGANQLSYIDPDYETTGRRVRIRIRLKMGEIRIARVD